jgi:hypothetical protein
MFSFFVAKFSCIKPLNWISIVTKVIENCYTMKQASLSKTGLTSTLIRRKKIVTLKDLAKSLHYSDRTAQRRLSELKILSSYNRNGNDNECDDV